MIIFFFSKSSKSCLSVHVEFLRSFSELKITGIVPNQRGLKSTGKIFCFGNFELNFEMKILQNEEGCLTFEESSGEHWLGLNLKYISATSYKLRWQHIDGPTTYKNYQDAANAKTLNFSLNKWYKENSIIFSTTILFQQYSNNEICEFFKVRFKK